MPSGPPFDPKPTRPPLLLGGPTATGKSDIAIALASLLDGEIISVDSMQVYRGMDIGTAKPSLNERTHVPHHLIDILPVSEPFDAATFVDRARAAAASIIERDRIPILCGGTGLYFRAFLEGLGESPRPDTSLRKELESTPRANLLEELRQTDPVTFERIDPHNPRRLVRAVEVIRLTGRPYSALRSPWRPTPPAWPYFALTRERNLWHERIDRRVDRMWAAGLADETAALLAQGMASNPTAMQAIGYRQVIDYLQGKRSKEETIALIKTRTRRFGRHQLTWFRRQPGLEWMPIHSDTSAEQIAHVIAERYQARLDRRPLKNKVSSHRGPMLEL